MRNYNEKDIRFYPEGVDGDFGVDASGDFAITDAYESARQDMANRIRTQKTDWRSHPNLGADLELLEGEPNTPATGARAEAQVYEALSYDNRFDVLDIESRAVPTSIEAIELFTVLNTDENGAIVVRQPLEL